MALNLEEWFKPETVNRGAAFIIIGVLIALRAVRSGWLIVGDKAKLLVKVAELETELKHKRETARRLKAENYALKQRVKKLENRPDENA